MITNWQLLNLTSIYQRTMSIGKILEMYLLGSLMCPSQITINRQALSLTIYPINGCFIHQTPNIENYLNGHNLDNVQNFQKQNVPLGSLIYPLQITNIHYIAIIYPSCHKWTIYQWTLISSCHKWTRCLQTPKLQNYSNGHSSDSRTK